jgi:hypothetical protein
VVIRAAWRARRSSGVSLGFAGGKAGGWSGDKIIPA